MKGIIETLLNDLQENHSRFQIENFIIGSQGGKRFQYRQCLREIKARWDNLKKLKDDKVGSNLELIILKKNSWKTFRKTSKIKNELGWDISIPIEETLKDMFDYWLDFYQKYKS